MYSGIYIIFQSKMHEWQQKHKIWEERDRNILWGSYTINEVAISIESRLR